MKLRILLFCALLASLASAHGTPTVEACGGPDFGDFGALAPVSATVHSMAGSDISELPREEFLFLYPFFREHPAELDLLWKFSYSTVDPDTIPKPDFAPFELAVREGKLDDADAHARLIIDKVLALPPVLGARHMSSLWRAVEFIELKSHLRRVPNLALRQYLLNEPGLDPSCLPPPLRLALGARTPSVAHAPAPDHPRAASMAFWAMQEDSARRIPNGWADSIRNQVTASTWQDLLRAPDTWLRAYSQHPLVDLVRLSKVRTLYFSGNVEQAWQVLIDLYPRRLARVLAEMRYLLMVGAHPTDRQVNAVADPVLITALLGSVTDAKWTQLWTLSLTAPNRPWSVNLQERLLRLAALRAKGNGLPTGFPNAPASPPTALWGKFRAAALLENKQIALARDQLTVLPVDSDQAALLVASHLAEGHPELAVQVPSIALHSRRYLLQVAMPTPALRTLASGNSPRQVAADARLELGIRLAHEGKWAEATRWVQSDDANRAHLWGQARQLAGAKTSLGRLRWAQYLEQHEEDLFYEPDRAFYRGVSSRHEALTPGSPQALAIERAITRTSALWLALSAYSDWLGQNPSHPDARRVLSQADHVYGQLINWGGGGGYFWGRYAPQSAAVSKLRAAGKTIRKVNPE